VKKRKVFIDSPVAMTQPDWAERAVDKLYPLAAGHLSHCQYAQWVRSLRAERRRCVRAVKRLRANSDKLYDGHYPQICAAYKRAFDDALAALEGKR